jgi:hypothetical protein
MTLEQKITAAKWSSILEKSRRSRMEAIMNKEAEKPMTRKEAKELTLELWRYLAEHPECCSKCEVPPGIYNKVKYLYAGCPLCELFAKKGCVRCPLDDAGKKCMLSNSPWCAWSQASPRSKTTRKKAAGQIVEIVSAWEPEGE